MLDRSVFARGIHALQDDEHLVFRLGIQHPLQLGESLVERGEERCALFFVAIKPISGTR